MNWQLFNFHSLKKAMKYGQTWARAFHARNIFYYGYILLLLVFHSIHGVILYKWNHSNTLRSTPSYCLLYIYCITFAARNLFLYYFIALLFNELLLLLLILIIIIISCIIVIINNNTTTTTTFSININELTSEDN